MKNLWLILFLSVLLCSCKKLFEDEEFSLAKTSYTGSELRIDGYYYLYDSSYNKYSISFYYENGVTLSEIWLDSLEAFDTQIEEYMKFLINIKTAWGLFVVNGDEIQQEFLEEVGYLHRIAYTYYGEIINDTTLHFYLRKESSAEVSEEIDATCHFVQFKPKPDSTNSFIEPI
ncbi:MAG: hypothetical protein ACOYXB_17275 [Bacteroidota bacterium]